MSQPPHPGQQPPPGQQPYPGQQPEPGQQPYPGQPYSGQAYPSQPYPSQPYPSQPYPSQPYSGGGVGPPPPPKSPIVKIVVGVVAAVLMLCVGGAAVVYLVARDGKKPRAAVVAAASESPRPVEPVEPPTVTVTAPKTVKGRPQLNDPALQKAVSGLRRSMASTPGTTHSVLAYYGKKGSRDVYLVAAATTVVNERPSLVLDAMLTRGLGSSARLTGLRATSPGPLGGVAKCGNGETSGIPVAVCAWADSASFGLVAAYFKTVGQLEPDFVKLRGQIEKRG